MTIGDWIKEESDIARAEGISIGRDEGISIGRDEGISIGRDEGISIGINEVARNMKDRDFSIEDICGATGLSEEEVRKL